MKAINVTISDEAHTKLEQFQKEQGLPNRHEAVNEAIMRLPTKKETATSTD